MNGTSAGKRRIAESLGSHITASFFVDESKVPSDVWGWNIALWGAGAALLALATIAVVVRVSEFVCPLLVGMSIGANCLLRSRSISEFSVGVLLNKMWYFYWMIVIDHCKVITERYQVSFD